MLLHLGLFFFSKNTSMDFFFIIVFIRGIDLEIKKGEFVMICGTSGGGFFFNYYFF